MRAFLIPLLLATAAAIPQAGLAQAMVQPLPGTTDADRLAEQMRALAANPRDLTALVAAGELSLELDDLSAAAALFARADKIDSRNARVKAGMGAILVRSERPGEALRYFAMADGYGIDPRRIASDRGFAFDLIGEQDRAQREYRVALKPGSADETDRDETARRYALSLGISGHEAQALETLDPLLRKTDRGAWRARAFVLAMNGKQAEATRIATTMLPPGMAQGLQPFFDRLPTLPAIDRAFAVHFGEVHTTAERLADRAMAPRLAALAPEPGTVTAVTVAQAAPLPATGRKTKATRSRPGRTEIASLAPAAATTNKRSVDLPKPPAYVGAPAQIAVAPVQPAVTRRQPVVVANTITKPATVTAPATQPTRVEARMADHVVAPTAQPIPAPARAVPVATMPAVPGPTVPVPTASQQRAVEPPPVQVASVTPIVGDGGGTRASRTSEDSILARIIAGLSIPASELDVAAPVRIAPAPPSRTPVSAAQVVVEAKAKEARDAAARKLVADKLAADKKLSDKKALADRKALAAKKLADAEKTEAAKAAAAEKKVARANPARIWVQVAGGAYAGDLTKAWNRVKAKAPAAFAGRRGWTTPLRATNRVLAGPFKTDSEARGFVNQLAKEGVSAFTFASDLGQPVTKLPSE